MCQAFLHIKETQSNISTTFYQEQENSAWLELVAGIMPWRLDLRMHINIISHVRYSSVPRLI